MTFFPRLPWSHIVLSTVVAALLLLPALFIQQFSLAILAVLGIALVFLLSSNPFYALLAYVMLIPVEELAVFQALGTPTRLAGLLFFATYLFHRRFQINLRAMPVVAWLWLFWITASLIWSPILKWDFYFQAVQLFIATLLITDYVSRFPQNLGGILNAYTISAVIIALFGIYNFFTYAGSADRFTAESRISGIEGQGVETFAFSLIPAFLIAFHHVIRPKHKGWQWLNIGLMLLFAIGMILSGTRGAWIATIGALLIVYIPKLRLGQYITIGIIILLGTMIALRIPLVADFINYRSQDAISSGGTGRIAIWKVSWKMYLDSPLIGIGWRMAEYKMRLQDFESASNSIIWNFDDGRFRPRVTHNIYLQTLLELGAIGFVLYLIWISSIIFTPLGNHSTLKESWTIVLAIFIAMLVGGITNPEFHKKYYWLALALPQGLRYYWMKNQLSRPDKLS